LIVYYVYALEQTADYQTLFEAVNDAVLILRQRYIAPSLINYIIYPQLYDFQARAAYRLGDELLAVNLADSVIWYHRQQATSADSASIKSHHLAIARIFRTKQTSLAKLGRYQEVLRQSKEIIALSIQDSALVGSILNNLGFAQLQIGRADSSRFYAEQALSIYQKLLSRPKADSNRLLSSKFETHLQLCLAHQESQAFREAVSHHQQAMDCLDHIDIQDRDVKALRAKVIHGQLLAQMGQHQAALQAFHQGLQIGVEAFDADTIIANPLLNQLDKQEPSIIYALAGKGDAWLEAYRSEGDTNLLRLAVECYQLAFAVEERLRLLYAFTDSKLYAGARNRPYYEHALQAAWQLYQQSPNDTYLALALEFVERNKAFVLWEAMNQSQVEAENLASLQFYELTDLQDYLQARDALVLSYFV
ncbi:MAG: hypothetical protein AAFP02_18910, partial [Bacteroidota bacterium]